jgi:hypothetical protein
LLFWRVFCDLFVCSFVSIVFFLRSFFLFCVLFFLIHCLRAGIWAGATQVREKVNALLIAIGADPKKIDGLDHLFPPSVNIPDGRSKSSLVTPSAHVQL